MLESIVVWSGMDPHSKSSRASIPGGFSPMGFLQIFFFQNQPRDPNLLQDEEALERFLDKHDFDDIITSRTSSRAFSSCFPLRSPVAQQDFAAESGTSVGLMGWWKYSWWMRQNAELEKRTIWLPDGIITIMHSDIMCVYKVVGISSSESTYSLAI